LAQAIVLARAQKTKEDFEPLYLDESALTAPSLGLQRVHLEIKHLGELALEMVRSARAAIVEGGKQDLDVLVNRDNQIDRLEMSILMYLGKLSQLEHTESQARDMISLTQIASTLEALSDVVTTNLTSLGSAKASRTDRFGNAKGRSHF
jgi:phosphate:Na+ symporter